MQVGATIAPLFALFCALSILGVCRDRTFNAVVAGSIPARLTIVPNLFNLWNFFLACCLTPKFQHGGCAFDLVAEFLSRILRTFIFALI